MYWPESNQRFLKNQGNERTMDFAEDKDMEMLEAVESTNFNGLLSDEVVMDWLVSLEAEDAAADAAEARAERTVRLLD